MERSKQNCERVWWSSLGLLYVKSSSSFFLPLHTARKESPRRYTAVPVVSASQSVPVDGVVRSVKLLQTQRRGVGGGGKERERLQFEPEEKRLFS